MRKEKAYDANRSTKQPHYRQLARIDILPKQRMPNPVATCYETDSHHNCLGPIDELGQFLIVREYRDVEIYYAKVNIGNPSHSPSSSVSPLQSRWIAYLPAIIPNKSPTFACPYDNNPNRAHFCQHLDKLGALVSHCYTSKVYNVVRRDMAQVYLPDQLVYSR